MWGLGRGFYGKSESCESKHTVQVRDREDLE